MIRTFWAALVTAVATPWTAAFIVLSNTFRTRNAAKHCRQGPRRWASRLLWGAGAEVVIEGAENLTGGGQILVGNHESWFDVLALVAHLPVDYRFVAKKELAKVPFFGPSWRACGHIGIDRQDRRAAIESLDEAGRQIRDGGVTIVMFPEGTRSKTGELRPFKKGAFVLAIQARVPVVPVGISGARDIMRKGSWRIRSGRITVRIGTPIPVKGMTHDERDRLAEVARERVRALRDGPAPLPGAALRDGPEERPPQLSAEERRSGVGDR